jgi:hypothetical protein
MRYDRPLPVLLRPDLDHAREANHVADGVRGRPRCRACPCWLEIAACEKFWADARARLGRLYRLSDRDLDEIESVIAERIGPRPLPAVQIGKVQAAE